MGDRLDLHDLTNDEIALVEGFVRLLRRRHAEPSLNGDEKERDWGQLPAASFAEDWDNDQDAAYDRWRERYGVPER